MNAASVRYLNRRALCERLGISRATSYRLQREGYLPHPVRFGPGTARWPVSEIEALERRAAEDRSGCKAPGPSPAAGGRP
jgi:predicted DNA-binding transcriptional regulator AlpA